MTKKEKKALYMREYYKRFPERAIERNNKKRERRIVDGDKIREQERQSKERNKDAVLGRKKNYRKNNAKKIYEYNKKYSQENSHILRKSRKKYISKNPDLSLELRARRRAAEISATPKWADIKKMRIAYLRMKAISEITGVQHHVDHIVPLRGRNVCGLHVPCNLRVISAEQNCKKSNKWGPA